jgi:hydrogenase maturation protease
MSDGGEPRVLLLGIGNLLWADEGFGVRCIEAMASRYRFGPNVTLLDGGTQGLYLVDQVRTTDVLVVFDAVDYGLVPGTLKRVEGDKVPQFLGTKKMSLHQTGFQEVLALANLLGDAPSQLLLIGVQPVELEDFGGSLRPEVKAALYPAIELALNYLAELGVRPLDVVASGAAAGSTAGSETDSLAAAGAGMPATEGSTGAGTTSARSAMRQDTRQDLPHPALDIAAYELGRPAPELACRSGDERVLARTTGPRRAGDKSSTEGTAELRAVGKVGSGGGETAWLDAGPMAGWASEPTTNRRMSR